MLAEFSLTCTFNHVWQKSFKFMVFAFRENALNPGIFTDAPFPNSKFQAEVFENLFPSTAGRGREKHELLYQH